MTGGLVHRTGDGAPARLDPASLADAVSGSWLVGPGERAPLLGAAIDTRRLRPGNLFFALKGERTDGHAFLRQAREAGASAAIVELPLGQLGSVPEGLGVLRVGSAHGALAHLASAFRRELHGTAVIGVTGSNGKTTTVRLIHAALAGAGLAGTHAQKSENNDLGVPLTLLNARPGDGYLVCEIGTNAPGEIAPLARLAAPSVGVITSIGRSHLEGLGSVGGVAREKAELLRALPENGTAVIPDGVPVLEHELAARPPSVRHTVRVGSGQSSDVTIGGVVSSAGGTRFSVDGCEASIPLPGAHNASNAAMALAVAASLRVPLERAAAGLAAVSCPEMRLERSRLPCPGGGLTVINDAYNANPDSTLASLAMLASGELDPEPPIDGAPSGPARRVAVLGDMLEMGEAGEDAHLEIVESVAADDRIVLTLLVGPVYARAAGRLGVLQSERFAALGERFADEASGLLRAGDIVLLKGSRGMRLERLIEELRAQGRASPRSAGRMV